MTYGLMSPDAKEPGGGQAVATAKDSPVSSVNQKHTLTPQRVPSVLLVSVCY